MKGSRTYVHGLETLDTHWVNTFYVSIVYVGLTAVIDDIFIAAGEISNNCNAIFFWLIKTPMLHKSPGHVSTFLKPYKSVNILSGDKNNNNQVQQFIVTWSVISSHNDMPKVN